MMPKEAPNPFGQLINPEHVAKALEASARLSRLQTRVCRPLDRPLIPSAKPSDPALAAFDAAIERASAVRRAVS
jgi:hypothetical protein